MTLAAFWLVWSLISLSLGFAVWRKIHGPVSVYALIVISGLYLGGVFVIYGLVNHIPFW